MARVARSRLSRGGGRVSRSVALLIVLGTLVAASPAQATTVSIGIEIPGQALVFRTNVTLPGSDVSPGGAAAGQTCPAASVIGALDTAVAHQWAGTWTDGPGWSIDTIRNVTATTANSRHWDIYLNNHYLNDPPCQRLLADGDRLLLFPRCTAGTSPACFSGNPLWIQAPSTASPGVFFAVQVWELVTGFDVLGNGDTEVRPIKNAAVYSPDGSAYTDYNGQASIPINAKGDNTVLVTKSTDVPDRANVCITDGADGYCGTTTPPTNPFDPYAFCKTTGSDGYCNSPDLVPPVGHVTQPQPDQKFSGSRPKLMKGTVDFDPSGVDSVNIRLMRQTTYTKYRIRKKKVTKKVKVHGRTVRKRVVKKIRKPYKAKGCFTWNPATSGWNLLKACNAALAKQFKADGADEWSFEFLSALPPGNYTLDALAKDGAGNVDSTMELGRNRVNFKVS